MEKYLYLKRALAPVCLKHIILTGQGHFPPRPSVVAPLYCNCFYIYIGLGLLCSRLALTGTRNSFFQRHGEERVEPPEREEKGLHGGIQGSYFAQKPIRITRFVSVRTQRRVLSVFVSFYRRTGVEERTSEFCWSAVRWSHRCCCQFLRKKEDGFSKGGPE